MGCCEFFALPIYEGETEKMSMSIDANLLCCTALYRRHVGALQCLGYRESFPSTKHRLYHRTRLTKLLNIQCDDLILRKVNSSDASVFAQRYGGSSRCWGLLWSLVSLIFIAIAIVAGIAAFPQSFSQQEDDSKGFLPTKF